MVTQTLKALVRSTIQRFPIVKQNRFYFHIQRFRQTRPLKVDYSLAPPGGRSVVETLEREGVIVIPDFASRATCEQILAEYAAPCQQMLDDTFTGRYQKDVRWGPYRILDAAQYSPTATRAFFENEYIKKIAQAYVAKDCVSYRRELDVKVHAGAFMQSDLPHFDDWRHRFKAFLYLTDCAEENGPFIYYPRSHRQDDGWKDRYYREYEVDGEDGRYGQFFPYEWNVLRQRHGFEELICTGKAGTLIFADFRGVHRGNPLKAGTRVLLNNTFGIEIGGLL